jgi:hypothetical protein
MCSQAAAQAAHAGSEVERGLYLPDRSDQGRGALGFTRVRQTSYGLHAFVIVVSLVDLRESCATSRELAEPKRSSFAAEAAANSSKFCSV